MLSVLAKSIREYKKPSLLAPLLVSGEVVMECIIPFVTANLVNQIKAGCSIGVIVQYGAVLVVMAGLSLTFGALAGSACATASCGFARNLRKDMFYKIQDYSFENIDKFSVSSLVTRMTTDVTNVQMAYMMIVRTAIRCPLMLVFSFAMAFIMGGKMAVIFLLVIPVLGVGLALVVRSTMPLFKRVFKKYDALNSSVQENIKGMRVVKSYVREEYEKQKFGAAAADVQRDFTRAERILAFNNPLMQFCVYAVMVFVLSFGSYTVITSRGLALDVGQMSSMLTYSFQILMSLMMLSMVFVMITMASESAQRIVEVLCEESALQSPENPVREVKDGSIDFDNVSFKYAKTAERMALSGIDLHIRSGETIGIIGGTGSSKSTLIQLISRLYDATEGAVRVGGVDVRSYDLEALRDQVAVVLQKNVLFSGSIRENLRWGNKDATDAEMEEACRLVLDYTPFPGSVCGGVCPNPCMEGCTRNELDSPVRIGKLGSCSEDIRLEKPATRSGKHPGVIGGGVGGLTAAWQLARRGIPVTLREMKPRKMTPAHHSGDFAELVCSNSLRSDQLENAVGLLKEELRRLGSLILACADETRVEAGGALAVDRHGFARLVTERVRSHPNITVIESEVTSIPAEGTVIVASGPLTSDALSAAIAEKLGDGHTLNFYDAAAPLVTYESVDMSSAWFASRYDKGTADYINCPMTEEEYDAFWQALTTAEEASVHGFEDKNVFEGCMPVEVMARRGHDTLCYGPLKPRGLRDPKTGQEPYAVVQLRRDNAQGSVYNLVGFQTHLRFPEQKRVFSMIPALHDAEFVRYGVMHRNTYLRSPGMLDRYYRLIADDRIAFAGQMTGVEGYIESAASGFLAGIEMARRLEGKPPVDFPRETAIGALGLYISDTTVSDFQPMNVNFGIMPPLGYRIKGGKRVKNAQLAARSLEKIDAMREDVLSDRKGE